MHRHATGQISRWDRPAKDRINEPRISKIKIKKSLKSITIIPQTNPNSIAEICSTEKFHMPLQERNHGNQNEPERYRKKETRSNGGIKELQENAKYHSGYGWLSTIITVMGRCNGVQLAL